MSARKDDSQKVDLSLLPLPAIVELSRALMYGEKKYGRNNFRAGFDTNRLIAASLRHIHAWNSGEDLDPESGVSHLGHALAALSMLLTNLDDGVAVDGRYYQKGPQPVKSSYRVEAELDDRERQVLNYGLTLEQSSPDYDWDY